VNKRFLCAISNKTMQVPATEHEDFYIINFKGERNLKISLEAWYKRKATC